MTTTSNTLWVVLSRAEANHLISGRIEGNAEFCVYEVNILAEGLGVRPLDLIDEPSQLPDAATWGPLLTLSRPFEAAAMQANAGESLLTMCARVTGAIESTIDDLLIHDGPWPRPFPSQFELVAAIGMAYQRLQSQLLDLGSAARAVALIPADDPPGWVGGYADLYSRLSAIGTCATEIGGRHHEIADHIEALQLLLARQLVGSDASTSWLSNQEESIQKRFVAHACVTTSPLALIRERQMSRKLLAEVRAEAKS